MDILKVFKPYIGFLHFSSRNSNAMQEWICGDKFKWQFLYKITHVIFMKFQIKRNFLKSRENEFNSNVRI